MAKQQDLIRARSALNQIEWTAKKALKAAEVLRDDLTRPNYTDEYAAMALCYGELIGMVRLILDTALREKEARDGV